MTLKGETNHYNIKFLKGYGFSVSLKDNKIVLKDGKNDILGKSETEEWFVTKIPYEKSKKAIYVSPTILIDIK